ncbi:hypothetical protein DPMN_175112 [Dreissena polymorpha]|uniref:Uncharacterized protein n=1 Tax=Dreissena polymorpha TaxID=45954 RepID=A0A9D4E7K1_DREPO|nr:hypothetical protein DPMN_175112 [Dreissena polymorpha]
MVSSSRFVDKTVEQLEEKLLGIVIRRIEILENDVFEQKREIELKKESESISKQIEDLKSQNAALENKQPCDTLNHEEFASNTEQAQLRNVAAHVKHLRDYILCFHERGCGSSFHRKIQNDIETITNRGIHLPEVLQ